MALRPCFGIRCAFGLLIGWITVPTLAQDVLPWNLSQYPSGGPAFTEVVALSLGEDASLTVQSCNALAQGSPAQTASGIAGIALAVFAAPQQTSDSIAAQFPECCDEILNNDVDAIITLGAAVALEARAWGESEIGLGRRIEQLIRLCEDDAFIRSYEIARGEDELGALIAQGTDDDPVSTGSIQLDETGGGGLESSN